MQTKNNTRNTTRRKRAAQHNAEPRKRGNVKNKATTTEQPRTGHFWKTIRKICRRVSEGAFWIVYSIMNYVHLLHARDVYELGLWLTAACLVVGLLFLGVLELPRMLFSAAFMLAILAFVIEAVSRVIAKIGEWLEKKVNFGHKKKPKQVRKPAAGHPRRQRPARTPPRQPPRPSRPVSKVRKKT